MVKMKLTYEQLIYLRNAIGRYKSYYEHTELPSSMDKDFEKMLIAFMEEFWRMLYQKEAQGKEKYTIKISPLWGFCLRLLFAGNLDRTTYFGNIIMRVCDEVDRKYQLNNN